MRKTISIDLDGVVAQFTLAFVEKAINRLYPEKRLPLNFEPNDWFYTGVLTEVECVAAMAEIFSLPYLWRDILPYGKNMIALQKFVRDNEEFDIYYITARPETPGDSAFSQTSKWLYNYGAMSYNTSLLVVKDSKAKLAVMQGLKVQASIDDYLPTVVACSQIPGHQAILLDRPWNRKDRPAGLKVVQSLQEYFNAVRQPNFVTQ